MTLTIQQKLSDLLKSKAIPAPKAGTVFVVFWLRVVQSTPWAGLQAGVTTLLTTTLSILRRAKFTYVVVPFHQNADNHSMAATRAFSEAALKPETAEGWF